MERPGLQLQLGRPAGEPALRCERRIVGRSAGTGADDVTAGAGRKSDKLQLIRRKQFEIVEQQQRRRG